MDELLMFESAICNENGEVVAWCRGLSDNEVQAILDEHEEYYLNCKQIN